MQTTEPMTPPAPLASAQTVIDLGAIDHNVRVLRELAGSADVMAVVKADAYGHGALPVARTALAAGAAALGVATIPERLRCVRVASRRRSWRGCIRPAPTSPRRSPPTSRSPCRRAANSNR